jgi:uncharacterized membrane protein YphA (DoxX/SURF4 family)
MDASNLGCLARHAVTCVTFPPAMRLPGTMLQGILASAALTFLRIYLGGVLVLQGWLGTQHYQAGGLVLLPWAELLVGSTLILGLLTRLSAAGALLIVVQPLFTKGLQLEILSQPELAWGCVALALIVGAAGRTFGLDALLAERRARSPFW